MKYLFGNTLAFVVMIVINTLANMLPINGKTTGELSDQYPNLFVPAGITFSIWAVIYVLLLAFIVRQYFTRFRGKAEMLGWFVTINFLLNALWIIAWHYEYVLFSLLIMISLLMTLVVINNELRNSADWMMRLTFGIYMGWICLATIANITALLVANHWTGFGISEQTWAMAVIIVGAIVGAGVMYKLTNPFLMLALIWGFYGIVLKRQTDYPAIAITSYAGMVIVLAMAMWVVIKPNSVSQLKAK